MFKDSNKFVGNRPKYLNRVYSTKKIYEQYLPLDDLEIENINKLERYKMVYTSNKLEGSSYSEAESDSLLDTGKPNSNKPIKDGIEIINLNRAIIYCNSYNGDINIDFIKFLHRIVTSGTLSDPRNEGEFKKVRNWVGDFNTSSPEAVNKHMSDLIDYYKQNLGKLDPVLLACRFKYRFLCIHPFIDGNGRTSRLLFNYILQLHGFIPCIVDSDIRSEYIDSLKESNKISKIDKFKCEPLEEFICNCLTKCYQRRIYMLEGDFE